jgi:hypothetical protein
MIQACKCATPWGAFLAKSKRSLSPTRKGGDEMNFWAMRSLAPEQYLILIRWVMGRTTNRQTLD